MSESARCRCNWCCVVLGLAGVIAIVLILMHRSDEKIHVDHSTLVPPGTGTGEPGGDTEPGAKKFDHIEIQNVTTGNLDGIELILQNQAGNPIYGSPFHLGTVDPGSAPALPPGQSRFFVVHMDGTAEMDGVRQVVLKHRYLDEGGAPRTKTCLLMEASPFFLRTATFWYGDPPGAPKPTFWGQAIAVSELAGWQNRVVVNPVVTDVPGH